MEAGHLKNNIIKSFVVLSILLFILAIILFSGVSFLFLGIGISIIGFIILYIINH